MEMPSSVSARNASATSWALTRTGELVQSVQRMPVHHPGRALAGIGELVVNQYKECQRNMLGKDPDR